jgi:hypothetical protein
VSYRRRPGPRLHPPGEDDGDSGHRYPGADPWRREVEEPWRITLDGDNYGRPEINLNLSGTILNNVIPVVYGSRRVPGLCAARSTQYPEAWLDFGFVFCFGEQHDPGTDPKVYLNDLEIWPASSERPAYVRSIEFRFGTGSESIPSLLTSGAYGIDLSAEEQARWKNFCYVTFKLDPNGTYSDPAAFDDFPGALNVARAGDKPGTRGLRHSHE